MAEGEESVDVLVILPGFERTINFAEDLLAGTFVNLVIDGEDCYAFVHKVEAVKGTEPHVLVYVTAVRYGEGTQETNYECILKYTHGGKLEFVSATPAKAATAK